MQLFVRDKQFYNTVLRLAVPIVLQGMITIGVNLMDTLMLGSYGEIQLSAASLANEFINIFHILCMGMGYGAAVLTAQYWGSQDIPALKKVVTIMLRICLALASLFTLVTFFLPGGLMRIYTTDEAIIEKGILYFRISAAAYLMMGLSLTLTAILRSVREVKVPLISSIVAFFVNIFFNWVFIFGNLGAPEMQIEGAALGTLIARFIEMLMIGGYFLFADKKIGYRVKDLFVPCRDYIPLYIQYSIPVLVSDALLAFGNNVVSMIMGRIGASFVAANAIVAQVTRMSTVFTQGVSNSSSVITGNTLGEGDWDKAYKQGITFLCLSVIIGLFAGGIILAICPLIIGGFNITAETTAIAYQLMYAVAIMVVFQSVQSVLTKGVLRGGGDTRFLMVADVLFLWLASIPLGYLAGLVYRLPAFWIYVALKADWMIKSVWCAVRLVKGKWLKRVA
ncbi:MAG: MATE family efflux transporter [Clostridia bacterium]|jgi:putative MATE family efflux protein